MRYLLAPLLALVFISPPAAFAKPKGINLTLVGDIMIGRLVNKHYQNPTKLWGNTISVLKKADVTIGNLETALTQRTQKHQPSKAFHFRAEPKRAKALTRAGFDLLALANNHVMDYGIQGLLDTQAILDRYGIAHAGASNNWAQAIKPAMVTAKGIKIALVSLTDNQANWKANPKRPGIFYAPINQQGLKLAQASYQMAKQQGADLVILSLHWGGNWNPTPPAAFQIFARAAIDSGFDIIHGHSAHIIQGIEIYKGKPIFYSLGDLIDDYALKPGLRNNLGLIATTRFSKNGDLQNIKLTPVRIHHLTTRLAQGTDFKTAAEIVMERSKRFNSIVKNKGTYLEIRKN